MKIMKEFLLFMVTLLAPLVLFLVISGFSADMLSDRPHFLGVANYIRPFLNDKTFGKALLNTILTPALFSFLIVAVFAMIVFVVRKKIKVPRWVFYLGSVLIGGVTTLFYTFYLSISFSHILDYKPSVFDAITLPNMLFSLYIGILTAFVFWILELMADIVKKFRSKRNM